MMCFVLIFACIITEEHLSLGNKCKWIWLWAWLSYQTFQFLEVSLENIISPSCSCSQGKKIIKNKKITGGVFVILGGQASRSPSHHAAERSDTWVLQRCFLRSSRGFTVAEMYSSWNINKGGRQMSGDESARRWMHFLLSGLFCRSHWDLETKIRLQVLCLNFLVIRD